MSNTTQLTVLLLALLLCSCKVYKQPIIDNTPLVLCHCPKDSVYKVGNITPAIDTAKLNTCKHYYTMVTLMGCIPPSNQCNTATCLSCGYSFKTF